MKIKDGFCFLLGIILLVGSFLPCWSAFGFINAAVIDEKSGMIIPVMAIIIMLASVKGIGIIQIICGIVPVAYLLIYRIKYRGYFSIVETRYGMWIMVIASVLIVMSGIVNLPKKKK